MKKVTTPAKPGSLGGKATFKKYGSKHYAKIALLSNAVQAKKRSAAKRLAAKEAKLKVLNIKK